MLGRFIDLMLFRDSIALWIIHRRTQDACSLYTRQRPKLFHQLRERLLALLNNGRGALNVLAKDVALEDIRQPDRCLMRQEALCRDGEDLCVAC
jgi:hypothetical protein